MNIFEHLSSFIVRPSRHDYRPGSLGPNSFDVKSKLDGNTLLIKRQDRCVRNRNGYKLHVSHYFNSASTALHKSRTVFYLHSNNGSRIEGLSYLRYLLESHFNVVLLDFSGSGMSEGEYVTLGLRQSEDLEDVIELLTNEGKLAEFALWGRSMGAVTALLYSSRNNHQPVACIYDSPFSSLEQLIQQVATTKAGIPQFLHTLQQQAKVNFSELRIRDRVHLIRCPGLFLTSKKDKLVHHEHCQQLFQLYPAEKKLQFIECEHHQTRSKDTIRLCIEFLKNNFNRSQPQRSSQHSGIGVTYVNRTDSFRRLDTENLNINIIRTPTSSFTMNEERTAQTSRYNEDEDLKIRLSPNQIRLVPKQAKKPQQKYQLQQIIEKTVQPKISLTQLKQGRQPRATQTFTRSHQPDSHGQSHKHLVEEQAQKLPLSRAGQVKTGVDRMVSSKRIDSCYQAKKFQKELPDGEPAVRRLHYKQH